MPEPTRRGRLLSAACLWIAASLITISSLTSVVAVLVGTSVRLLERDVAVELAAVPIAMGLFLAAALYVSVVIGIPVMGLIVAAWVGIGRVLPSIDGRMGIALVSALVAILGSFIALLLSSSGSDDAVRARDIVFAAGTGLCIWTGLVAPRFIIPLLRPGTFLWK